MAGLVLMAIAILVILAFKAAHKKKQPGQDSYNKAVNRAASAWNHADTRIRLTALCSIGIEPDSPSFNPSLLSVDFSRLDHEVQIRLIAVTEGVRTGVFK